MQRVESATTYKESVIEVIGVEKAIDFDLGLDVNAVDAVATTPAPAAVEVPAAASAKSAAAGGVAEAATAPRAMQAAHARAEELKGVLQAARRHFAQLVAALKSEFAEERRALMADAQRGQAAVRDEMAEQAAEESAAAAAAAAVAARALAQARAEHMAAEVALRRRWADEVAALKADCATRLRRQAAAGAAAEVSEDNEAGEGEVSQLRVKLGAALQDAAWHRWKCGTVQRRCSALLVAATRAGTEAEEAGYLQRLKQRVTDQLLSSYARTHSAFCDRCDHSLFCGQGPCRRLHSSGRGSWRRPVSRARTPRPL